MIDLHKLCFMKNAGTGWCYESCAAVALDWCPMSVLSPSKAILVSQNTHRERIKSTLSHNTAAIKYKYLNFPYIV